MSGADPRLGWPCEWLAFELLRRRARYCAAWKDYFLDLLRRRPEGTGHHCAAQAAVAAAAGKPWPDLLSQRWAAPFGLQHMLDPAVDAELHGHVPWRPAQGPIPVDFVRGPESSVFDPAANPPQGWGAIAEVGG
jgi:CubicO group peptidase (beta-lactamase class C family)